jgi:hypothetical protein
MLVLSGSGSSTTTGTQTSHGSTAGAQVTKAQAVAYAHEVNLIAADVPGAIVRSEEVQRGAASSASVRFARCAGAVNPNRRLTNIKSATFKVGKGLEAIRLKSSVEVMPSAALAARDYAAARDARGRACLARLLPKTLQGPATLGALATTRARFGPATASFPPNLSPAGQESFAIRVATTLITQSIRYREIRLPVYLDFFAILAGPAEINLSAVSISHPPPTAIERRLLSVLYSRAQAHKL